MSSSLTIVTHSGNFHADDVFACATLSLRFKDKEIKIIRSRDPEIFPKADILVDVGEEYDPGKSRFDHHQNGGAGFRENGIPYASFGLVWKEYGKELCSNTEVTEKFDAELVAPIDAGDNGFELADLRTKTSFFTISSMVGIFNASWSEDADTVNDSGFFKMVSLAKEIILREILFAEDFVQAKVFAQKAYQEAVDKRIIILDGAYPAEDVLKQYPEPLYIVKPRQDKRWGVKCISSNESKFSRRKELPKEWAGLRDEELQKVTGVKDAIFCHRALFTAVASSKEGALELAKIAVES